MIPAPKRYQKDAISNILDIFGYVAKQIQQAPDEHSRANAVAHNGVVLLQAPTGAGKTMMAGNAVEDFSRLHNVVWFWFTPFATLVEQAKSSMKQQFQGIRVRDIKADRFVVGTKSGDVFVTTWASVAANNKDTKKIRKDGDMSMSVDSLLPELREAGFHIGIVVDEAHHGFGAGTEAVRFYNEVLKPEYTLLVTATPDDKDIAKFKQSAKIREVHTIAISRRDVVDAGLIKPGVKSFAYLASEEQKQLIDFQLAALTDALSIHKAIKMELAAESISLTPLILIQVDSSPNSVENARKKLISLGMPTEAIASYTSDEPTDDLLTVAMDETKEALIFKMAVALGFDAPRAFTLVSMRGSQDVDFGIQVVGRILRVHNKLQGRKNLPERLKNGYVFLADMENQAGLTSAASRINSINTELSKISPNTMVVMVAGKPEVQIVENGQTRIFSINMPNTPDGSVQTASTEAGYVPSASTFSSMTGMPAELSLDFSPVPERERSTDPRPAGSTAPGNKRWNLKPEVEAKFKRERLPVSTNDLLRCIGNSIKIDDRVFNAGFRDATEVTRIEIEIFSGVDHVEKIQARLSDAQIQLRAQRSLTEPDYLHPRDLQDALITRLKNECQMRGWVRTDQDIRRALNLILVSFPNILKRAAMECAANYAEVVDCAKLPEFLELPASCRTSRLNIYGVFPDDLNKDEADFGMLLDTDTTNIVEWWHRNDRSKPWSIALVLPNGSLYHPDFVVKVRGRTKSDGLLLLETKGPHLLNYDDTLLKIHASHKTYGRPLMITLENGRWMTVRHNDRNGKNEIDSVFRIEGMTEY
ncbi:MAG: DEAD/DEAH box helicase family protein [Pseudomonadota bacterium]